MQGDVRLRLEPAVGDKISDVFLDPGSERGHLRRIQMTMFVVTQRIDRNTDATHAGAQRGIGVPTPRGRCGFDRRNLVSMGMLRECR